MNPRRLFQALNEESAEVILIGGVAMIAHGISYNTNDIDLCYKRDRDNIERLIRAIAPFNPRMRVENLTDAEAQALPFQFDVRSPWNIESLTLMTDCHVPAGRPHE